MEEMDALILCSMVMCIRNTKRGATACSLRAESGLQ